MLMTVLKGELAVRQSKALIRLFKEMKDYIIENKAILTDYNLTQLAIQTSDNTKRISEIKAYDRLIANLLKKKLIYY